MNDIALKSQVIDLLQLAHHAEQGLMDGVPEAEREVSGTPSRMSVKDLVAHLTAAKQREALRLAVAAEGGTPESDDHDPAQIVNDHQHCPWSDIQAEAEQAFNALVGQVERFTLEDLSDSRRYPWLRGRPLVAEILGYGLWHPVSHLAEWYRRQDQVPHLDRRYHSLVPVYHSEWYRRQGQVPHLDRLYHSLLDALPHDVQAVLAHDASSLYNLAGVYGVLGQAAPALRLLSAALELNPELRPELRDDPDFEALRTDPAFLDLQAKQPD